MTGTTCRAEDCERAVYARGLCGRHYKQWQRHGEVQREQPVTPCAVASCERRAVTRGWCHGHYLRVLRTGDVGADRPLRRATALVCSVPDCHRSAHARGLCQSHARRARQGDDTFDRPVRTTTGDGWVSHGYYCLRVPEELRWLTGGRPAEAEHRLVMALRLGRPLETDEVVHHRNGDRLDNDPDNLELWTTAQPKGQRVSDRVEHALRLLARYDRDASEALGLTLDPDSGLPHDP